MGAAFAGPSLPLSCRTEYAPSAARRLSRVFNRLFRVDYSAGFNQLFRVDYSAGFNQLFRVNYSAGFNQLFRVGYSASFNCLFRIGCPADSISFYSSSFELLIASYPRSPVRIRTTVSRS